MRLWTLHPRYLDAKGLVALWREALLAKYVLQNRTTGYRHHPQLERFRAHERPMGAINAYLSAVWIEAAARGYTFDRTKVRVPSGVVTIPATRGQMVYEWMHLLGKLRRRDRRSYRAALGVKRPSAHPLFAVSPGGIARWERPTGR